jgi:hypothetical protein
VCELMDLGYTGMAWTFEKKVAGGTYCRVRLDRALATTSWTDRFPLAALQHLTAAACDHSPILLRHAPKGERVRHARFFRYEAMWESHQDFIPMIEASWGTTTCNSMHGL